jgi:CHAT domain-containing protein
MIELSDRLKLLQAFANLLHQGKGKAEALRNAQRRMLREHPHPYYWAGFYFSGDPGPLGTPEK